jgi:hypothetical protein
MADQDVAVFSAEGEMSDIKRQAQQLEAGNLQERAKAASFGAADLAAEGGDWTVWLREKTVEALRERDAEIERLRGLVDACSIFLKEDETPAQRIERERADTEAVLKLLLKEKRYNERLRSALEFVLEAARWHFDGDADPKNESPEDMTAHINGLIVQRVREALGE